MNDETVSGDMTAERGLDCPVCRQQGRGGNWFCVDPSHKTTTHLSGDDFQASGDGYELAAHRNGDGSVTIKATAVVTLPNDDAADFADWLRRVCPRHEIAQLRGWKESAMTVLAEWDRVHEALGQPGPLGASKALSSLAEIERLVAAVAGLQEEGRPEPRRQELRDEDAWADCVICEAPQWRVCWNCSSPELRSREAGTGEPRPEPARYSCGNPEPHEAHVHGLFSATNGAWCVGVPAAPPVPEKEPEKVWRCVNPEGMNKPCAERGLLRYTLPHIAFCGLVDAPAEPHPWGEVALPGEDAWRTEDAAVDAPTATPGGEG